MKVLIVDQLAPEDTAMLQALYSRSAASVEQHLEKLGGTASGDFMKKYYVGYNHKSIADCGSTTFFIEGVSLLAAKAIQNWPLYSGQETSTRYVNMAEQPIINPFGEGTGCWWAATRGVYEKLLDFYVQRQEAVALEVCRRYPQNAGEDNTTYARAVRARVLDILRGFLPAGITTQLSWHTNLRQADDHLRLLRYHPLGEVRAIALALTDAFYERYPSTASGAHASAQRETASEVDDWYRKNSCNFTYPGGAPILGPGTVLCEFRGDKSALDWYQDALEQRPRGAVLPHFMSDMASLNFKFLLDFGSFRDLQRHRNGVCRMPVLSHEYGFEPWYLDNLDAASREAAEQLLEFLCHTYKTLPCSDIARQYLIPLGYRVPVSVTYGLPAAVYVLELRSSKTVHPTLRCKAQMMAQQLQECLPAVHLHVDTDPDDWTLRRGKQVIEEVSCSTT